MFRITFRKINGSTDVAVVAAKSEDDARNTFMKRYDGRIIEVTKVS